MTLPSAYLTADVALFTLASGALELLLIKRGHPPEQGRWALPGGFVETAGGPTGQGEDLEEAARRELSEETGLSLPGTALAQVGAFGRPGRDPRGRVVTVAFLGLATERSEPTAGDDAAFAAWREVASLTGAELAFDHAEIVEAALAALRRDVEEGAARARIPARLA